MRIRERTYGSPLRALASFVLLVGILSMHGLTAHDVGMPWMAPAADSHVDHPRSSDQGPLGAVHGNVPSVRRASVPTGVPMIRAIVPAETGHGLMELCVGVLSLLLLLVFLGRVHGDGRITFSGRFLRSLRRMAGRAPPQHLCPSLTDLCIARV